VKPAASSDRAFNWLIPTGAVALYVLLFWPGISAGHLLAPGDGMTFFLPGFLGRHTLWDPTIQNGFPLAADPQTMTWYPVARLFSLAGSWNAFIVFPYVWAAFWMYRYAWLLTGNRFAAGVSGLVYSMSGFMMSHLGHVAYIHAAGWLPLVLLGLEQALRKGSWRWAMAAAGAVAMIFLAGNPQLTLYTGLFCAARAAALVAGRQARLRSALVAGAGVAAAALGLAAIQVLPSREFQVLSVRETIDYSIFSAYSLHPVELLTGLFPYVLGSRSSPLYPLHYIGWSGVEGAFHVGFVALFLAIVALSLAARPARYWAWTFVAVLLLASDGHTALGPLLFHVPVYQLFRSHGRWMLFADFSAALLAGYGAAALSEGVASRDALRLGRRFGLTLAAAGFALFTLAPFIHERAAQFGVGDYQVSWRLNAVRIPLAIALAGAAALMLWMRSPGSRMAQGLVAAALLASLASQARYDEWRTWPLTTADLSAPAGLELIGREARARQASLVAVDSSGWPGYEGEPLNFSRIWRWPTLSYYDPLYLKRFAEALSLNADAYLNDPTIMLGPAPDVYGALFATVTPHPGGSTIPYGGLRLPDQKMELVIGNPANGKPNPRDAQVPIPPDARKILLVSVLGNSTPIGQGDTVAQAEFSLASGRRLVVPLRAGIDTAEYSLECADVRPFMQHGLAPVFSTRIVQQAGKDCPLHNYIATIEPGAPEPIMTMTLRYVHPAGVLIVSNVWSVRPDGTVSAPDTTSAVTDNPLHWRARGRTRDALIFENLRVMERAWVTPAVRKLGPAEIQLAVRSGRFADGSPFDPRRVALVETGVAGFDAQEAAEPAAARATVTQPADTRLDVAVESPRRGFLVVRDAYYPGWRAWRNGAAVPIYQTNYLQRGVVVEAGQNHIRFEYVPWPFRLGLAITAITAALALATCLPGRLRALVERLFGREPSV